jgi:hypothetical protein
MTTLEMEMQALRAQMDELVVEYTDFDGSRKTAYMPGWEQVATRMGHLEELMDLRTPLTKTYGWGVTMRMGDCPCGMTNEVWAAREAHYNDMALAVNNEDW